jgi:hypothetical protein
LKRPVRGGPASRRLFHRGVERIDGAECAESSSAWPGPAWPAPFARPATAQHLPASAQRCPAPASAPASPRLPATERMQCPGSRPSLLDAALASALPDTFYSFSRTCPSSNRSRDCAARGQPQPSRAASECTVRHASLPLLPKHLPSRTLHSTSVAVFYKEPTPSVLHL